jgi:hypothetical protein
MTCHFPFQIQLSQLNSDRRAPSILIYFSLCINIDFIACGISSYTPDNVLSVRVVGQAFKMLQNDC